MGIIIPLLYVIEVAVCLLLAGVVMLQKPKEGGLGGLAGGMGEAVFGADAGNVLIKATIWLGAIFLVNTLLLARLTSTSHSASLMESVKPAAPAKTQQMPAMPAPTAPAAPATAPAAKPATPAPAPAVPAPATKPATPAPAPAPATKPATPAPAAAPAAKPATPAPAPAAPAKK